MKVKLEDVQALINKAEHGIDKADHLIDKAENILEAIIKAERDLERISEC
jgi:hypothetical protein